LCSFSDGNREVLYFASADYIVWTFSLSESGNGTIDTARSLKMINLPYHFSNARGLRWPHRHNVRFYMDVGRCECTSWRWRGDRQGFFGPRVSAAGTSKHTLNSVYSSFIIIIFLHFTNTIAIVLVIYYKLSHARGRNVVIGACIKR